MQTIVFLFWNKFSSILEIPDLWEPAIGWDKIIFEAEEIFKWFFTLAVSVIVIFVFHKFLIWLRIFWVFLGETEITIKSILSTKSLWFMDSIESKLLSIILSSRAVDRLDSFISNPWTMIPLFFDAFAIDDPIRPRPIINTVSYTHLRAHET